MHLSQYNPKSLTWGRDTIRKDEGCMKALWVFLCSINIECWAVFHLNLGSFLCGILIVLPLVWISSPFTAYTWLSMVTTPAHTTVLETVKCLPNAEWWMVTDYFMISIQHFKYLPNLPIKLLYKTAIKPYEKRFGWPQYSLKMVFWKELINKQTILELLTSWGQQLCDCG